MPGIDLIGRQPHFLQADDVFQHFALKSLDAVPKLFHCLPAEAYQDSTDAEQLHRAPSIRQRVHRCWEPSQYELQVVQRNQLPPSYLTVTAAGVVQVCGVQPAGG